MRSKAQIEREAVYQARKQFLKAIKESSYMDDKGMYPEEDQEGWENLTLNKNVKAERADAIRAIMNKRGEAVDTEGAGDYTLQKEAEPERRDSMDAIMNRGPKVPKAVMPSASDENTGLEPFLTMETVKNAEDAKLMKEMFGDFTDFEKAVAQFGEQDYNDYIGKELTPDEFASILGESAQKKRNSLRKELEEKRSKRHVEPEDLEEKRSRRHHEPEDDELEERKSRRHHEPEEDELEEKRSRRHHEPEEDELEEKRSRRHTEPEDKLERLAHHDERLHHKDEKHFRDDDEELGAIERQDELEERKSRRHHKPEDKLERLAHHDERLHHKDEKHFRDDDEELGAIERQDDLEERRHNHKKLDIIERADDELEERKSRRHHEPEDKLERLAHHDERLHHKDEKHFRDDDDELGAIERQDELEERKSRRHIEPEDLEEKRSRRHTVKSFDDQDEDIDKGLEKPQEHDDTYEYSEESRTGRSHKHFDPKSNHMKEHMYESADDDAFEDLGDKFEGRDPAYDRDEEDVYRDTTEMDRIIKGLKSRGIDIKAVEPDDANFENEEFDSRKKHFQESTDSETEYEDWGDSNPNDEVQHEGEWGNEGASEEVEDEDWMEESLNLAKLLHNSHLEEGESKKKSIQDDETEESDQIKQMMKILKQLQKAQHSEDEDSEDTDEEDTEKDKEEDLEEAGKPNDEDADEDTDEEEPEDTDEEHDVPNNTQQPDNTQQLDNTPDNTPANTTSEPQQSNISGLPLTQDELDKLASYITDKFINDMGGQNILMLKPDEGFMGLQKTLSDEISNNYNVLTDKELESFARKIKSDVIAQESIHQRRFTNMMLAELDGEREPSMIGSVDDEGKVELDKDLPENKHVRPVTGKTIASSEERPSKKANKKVTENTYTSEDDLYEENEKLKKRLTESTQSPVPDANKTLNMLLDGDSSSDLTNIGFAGNKYKSTPIKESRIDDMQNNPTVKLLFESN